MNAATRPVSEARWNWLIVPLLTIGFLASFVLIVGVIFGLARLALWVLGVTA